MTWAWPEFALITASSSRPSRTSGAGSESRSRRATEPRSNGGASWTEDGQELTFAGVTVLHFDDEGKVVEHRDYNNHVERREPPYADWSSA